MCKTHRTQNYRAPRFLWYSFGDICRPFQPSHLKNHEVHFFTKLLTRIASYAVVHRQAWPCAKPIELKTFVHQDIHGIHLGTFVVLSNPHISKITNFTVTKLPTKPSRYAVVHRPSWPCAKPSELKTSMHQDFNGIHLVTFGGQSNHHISKTTNFNFSQNSTPGHLALPWCTDQLGHVQNPPNSKLLCSKTFRVFIWGHLEANPTLTSQKPRISIFHKTPHQAI